MFSETPGQRLDPSTCCASFGARTCARHAVSGIRAALCDTALGRGTLEEHLTWLSKAPVPGLCYLTGGAQQGMAGALTFITPTDWCVCMPTHRCAPGEAMGWVQVTQHWGQVQQVLRGVTQGRPLRAGEAWHTSLQGQTGKVARALACATLPSTPPGKCLQGSELTGDVS